jgi:hypothetical protein
MFSAQAKKRVWLPPRKDAVAPACYISLFKIKKSRDKPWNRKRKTNTVLSAWRKSAIAGKHTNVVKSGEQASYLIREKASLLKERLQRA